MHRVGLPFFWLVEAVMLKRHAATLRGEDRLFVATLYTSDSEKTMRYTDEVRPEL